MPEQGAAVITPKPSEGRVFEAARRIRLGDVDPTGRCLLDAAVRHLQDVARDDSADSDLAEPMNWVVRRVMLEVHRAPVFQEWIHLATWCSGHGGRWAERRTEIRGDDGAHIEAATVWIFIDGETGAPKPLHEDFFDIYGTTAASRKVSARTVCSVLSICRSSLRPARVSREDESCAAQAIAVIPWNPGSLSLSSPMMRYCHWDTSA